MVQFAAVLRELRGWLLSFSFVRFLVPYTLHLLFGGLIVLFVEDFLVEVVSYEHYDTLDLLFNTIPLHALAFYAFFAGIWLALVSPGIKHLPYGMWVYALLALFPFHDLGLIDFVRAILFGIAGWLLFQFVASSASNVNAKGSAM